MSEFHTIFFFFCCLPISRLRSIRQAAALCSRWLCEPSCEHTRGLRGYVLASLRAYAALFCDRRSTFIIGCFVRSFRSNTLLTRGKDAARAARYCPEDGHPRRIRFQCINNLTRVQTRQTYHKTRYVDLDERRHITIKSVQDMPKAARHDAVRRRREMHMDVHFSRQLL